MTLQIKAIDNEQEDIQSLGFFGIFKESLKILLTCPKIFIQIILAFIFPQYCLFLAYDWSSKLIMSKIVDNTSSSVFYQVDSPTYNHILSSIFSEWVIYWLVIVVYAILSVILSLFTISAVVYTVACIYTGKDFTFKRVVSVVPGVCKRLMLTFLCKSCIMFAFFFIVSIVAIILIIVFYKPGEELGIAVPIIVFILAVICIVIFFYITMIWLLAYVVSVLEKNCGFKALKKSKELIRGKMGTSFAIILVINICAMPMVLMVQKIAGYGIIERVCLGFVGVVMLGTLVTLYSLIVQTVFYIVCKSYHHQSVDKSSLADHLDEYVGEYVPLNTEAVPLGDLSV